MSNTQAKSSRVSVYGLLYTVLCLVCCLASVAFSNPPQEQETQVVVRFWIISVVFALAGLATLKLR